MKQIILTVLFLANLSGMAFAQKNNPINVATYNLRYNNKGDGINAWPNRKENVKALIVYHDFDMFGVQEAFIHQL